MRADLAYHAPPYGTQVKLSDLPADAQLPEGAPDEFIAGMLEALKRSGC